MSKSLVCFPFKKEDVEVFTENIKEALSSDSVGEVLCVGAVKNNCYLQSEKMASKIKKLKNKKITFTVQERLGRKRAGKGDGMNTALKYFIEKTGFSRIHFYDADIKNFSSEWILESEKSADMGFDVVRHYFPRARTDAMITWMITKTGFSILFPDSQLPFIEQPLGGELLMKRKVAEKLVKDGEVMAQSDWGIDTIYTYKMLRYGFSMYETYMSEGKDHALYPGLDALESMLYECFSVIHSLKDGKRGIGHIKHRIEHASGVSNKVENKLGFDIQKTILLLTKEWTPKQEQLLDNFPAGVKNNMAENRKRPYFNFMDDANWYRTYKVLLKKFKPGDEDWRKLLFKLWVSRVLWYTMNVALKGYDFSFRHLYRMIDSYARVSKKIDSVKEL